MMNVCSKTRTLYIVSEKMTERFLGTRMLPYFSERKEFLTSMYSFDRCSTYGFSLIWFINLRAYTIICCPLYDLHLRCLWAAFLATGLHIEISCLVKICTFSAAHQIFSDPDDEFLNLAILVLSWIFYRAYTDSHRDSIQIYLFIFSLPMQKE